jgi:deoxycytidine triphosphate deaminase
MNGQESQPPQPRYAGTKQDAVERAESWGTEDPYPNIPPALLNAADIQDYVAATGMIAPFYDQPSKLKAASYEVDLLGKYVYWDASGNQHSGTIDRDQPFILEPNSIAFVTLEPYFRLPNYIALRFNLRITHVYRGLLLGTGPLVDPGFAGKLSIPLHNLTTNQYRLTGGEGLIWVEFTKLSPRPGTAAAAALGLAPHPDAPAQQGRVDSNPDFESKKDREVEYFLLKADPYRPIRSSIPAATADAEAAARDARATTVAFRRIASLAAFAAFVGIAGLIFAIYSLLTALNSRVDGLERAEERVERAEERVEELEDQVRDLTARLDEGAAAPASPASPPAAPPP